MTGRFVGFGLIGLSCLLYGGLLVVPFSPFPVEAKVALSGALVVCGEIAFWVGGILLGRELVSRYRRALNPLNWLRRGDRDSDPKV